MNSVGILYVQNLLTHFYSNLLYVMGQDFLGSSSLIKVYNPLAWTQLAVIPRLAVILVFSSKLDCLDFSDREGRTGGTGTSTSGV